MSEDKIDSRLRGNDTKSGNDSPEENGNDSVSEVERMRHSCSHILAQAVLSMFPEAKLGIGPSIENGFYYDFELPRTLIPEDLPLLEKKMKQIVKQNQKFVRRDDDGKRAIEFLEETGQKYKVELAKEYIEAGETISFYENVMPDGKAMFVDMCEGPHTESTGKVGAFKLTHIAGAYWRGDSNNPMLQRIYGLCFETQAELDDHLKMIEEAKKRDHRKLGQELDLFHIDDKVGAGLVLWHPKGAILWRVIEDFWYRQHLKNGYELVRSPHIGNRILWETSGHWGFYNESMYPPMEAGQSLSEQQEGKKAEISEQYLLKPMNCPFHVQIYNNKLHSYRELPFRWAETGTVYRFEKTGQLSGLTRVRGFTQDDAHIILTKEQVKDELKKVIDFILFMFKAFGFDEKTVNIYLSLRDPENKQKYAGGDEGWDFTEKVLREVAVESGLNFTEEKGEAAFYGPKLDFKLKDVLGREWQCSTLQFDFNLPEKFDMKFINQEGQEERPYMLHRALFGSFERFIGLLIENYAGAFPLWLAPVQVAILSVSEKYSDYAKKIAESLKESEIRVELYDSNDTLGKKIRTAEMQKIPYMLVVGEKEMTEKTVTARDYATKNQVEMKTSEFLEKVVKESKV
ncbi:MAG: threonine--tRNA ligase [Candidatus Gracilibacteria bacterium]|nr:threonine--tRNA ligase [Candidatus Gracilibacteria bacterium]